MSRQVTNPLNTATAEYGDTQFAPPTGPAAPAIDMHKVLKTGNVPDGISGSRLKGQLVEVSRWLPFLAEEMNISRAFEDYVLVPTLIFATEIPNANLCAFPFEEMSKWNVGAGCLSYESWRKKPCLAGDSLVSTDKGLIPIRDVGVSGATRVKTKDGQARIREFIPNGYGRIHVVRTRMGNMLRVTDNHPFLVLEPGCFLRWKDARDLRPGDRVVISTASPASGNDDLTYAQAALDGLYSETFLHVAKNGAMNEKVKYQVLKTARFPTRMTPELARILGYLASEGCVRTRSTGFSNTNTDVVRDYVRCWKACFGEEPSVVMSNNDRSGHGGRRGSRKRIASVKFSRRDVVEWLTIIGMPPVGCERREVPHCIMRASPEHRVEFVRAYVEGDGCLSGGTLQMHSVSHDLLHQMKVLLQSIGFVSKLGISRAARPETNRRDLWRLAVCESALAMAVIGTISRRRARVLKTWGSSPDHKELRVPYAKKWAMATARQHATGKGSKTLYWTHDGRSLKMSVDVARRNAKAMLTRENAEHFASVLGVLDPAYEQKMRALVGDFVFDEVRDVRDTGLQEPVYDIATTAGQFVANGLVVHNCFVEHANNDHTVAKGCIFDASMRPAPEFIGGLHRVVLLNGWDRSRDPALAAHVATGRTGFSMGAWVEQYSCSICTADVNRCNGGAGCDHIHPKFGPRMKEVGGKLVYRIARGVTGFECSSVATPAYRAAMAEAIG